MSKWHNSTCKLLLSLHCQGNTTGLCRNGTRSDGQAIVAVVKRETMGLARSCLVCIFVVVVCVLLAQSAVGQIVREKLLQDKSIEVVQ
jgi:hypothetical protein